MPIEYQQWITRQDLRNNPDKVYVFGDNFDRVGLGGQAKQMRGESNAVGIPTKLSPRSYLDDTCFWDCLEEWKQCFELLQGHLKQNTTIVFPSDGIGTGLADLENQAPRCWKLLQLFMEDLKEYAHALDQGH